MSIPSPFEIYGASTASYGKKVSSTYQRYACGTFLPNSLYLRNRETSLLVNTSGIRAASENPQRIITDRDVSGSLQYRVTSIYNIHTVN